MPEQESANRMSVQHPVSQEDREQATARRKKAMLRLARIGLDNAFAHFALHR